MRTRAPRRDLTGEPPRGSGFGRPRPGARRRRAAGPHGRTGGTADIARLRAPRGAVGELVSDAGTVRRPDLDHMFNIHCHVKVHALGGDYLIKGRNFIYA